MSRERRTSVLFDQDGGSGGSGSTAYKTKELMVRDGGSVTSVLERIRASGSPFSLCVNTMAGAGCHSYLDVRSVRECE